MALVLGLVGGLATLGWHAWIGLQGGLRDTEHMSLVVHQGFHTLNELRYQVGETRRMAMGAILTRDPAEKLRLANDAREAGAQVENLFGQLQASPIDFEAVQGAWSHYWHRQQGTLDTLLRRGANLESSLVAGARRFERVETTLSDASRAFESYAARQADRIDAEMTRALREVWLLWVAALVGIATTAGYHHRRVVAERALEADAGRIALLESVLDAVLTADEAGVVVEVNSGAVRAFGAVAAALVGRPLGALVLAEECPPGAAAVWLATRCAETNERCVEAEACRPDGTRFPAEVRVVDSDGPDGRRYAAHLRDITERRRAEHELRCAMGAAETTALAKSEYVAMISHEIRTPLNVLTGMAALLDNSPLNASQRAWVAAGRSASAAVLSVVNNVLDSAQLGAGRLAIDPQPVAVAAIVQEAIGVVAFSAAQKHLVLEHTVDDSVPATTMVDPARVRQVLINLLGNAVKFTRVGGIALHVSAVPISGTDDTILRFRVSDSGIGIEPDRLPGMFDAFAQGNPSTYRLYGGSGLGLSICKRLAVLLGGDLTVESRLGTGSVFTFTCRATVLEPGAAGAAAGACPGADAETPPAFSSDLGHAHPLEILVVDDDEASRSVAADLLAHFGYRPRVARDGAQAIAAIDAVSYDLVFMDLQMPGLDGCDVTRRILERAPPAARPRIVALTANVGEHDRARSADAGMLDYLIKPIAPADLRRVLVATPARFTT